MSELTTVINGYPFESEYFVRGDGAPLVRIRDLNSATTEVSYIGPVVENAWIGPGDVIVGMDGDFNVARWNGGRALLNQRMCCVRPNASADARFIAYLLPLALKVINDLTYSTTVKHLSSGDVRKLLLGAPPVDEQHSIAAFLERKTGEIDDLVAKKRQLIELLEEKRIAVITYAVTKGLDPDVAMKDSGVEWLGEIPVHWQVRPLRWALSVRSGEALPNSDFQLREEAGLDVVVIGGNGVMGYTNRVNTPFACIAIGRVGALCGNVHVVDPPAWVTDNALMVSDMKGFDREYLALLLRVLDLNRWASQNAQPLITGGFVKAQRVCVPPAGEQHAIATSAGRETARIDQLIGRVRAAIERLEELRAALISAAVTGKIDVREAS
jgi:type I restriction enzyme S subunit